MSHITPTHLYRRYLITKLILSRLQPGKKFLEIGCGTGEFSQELAELGFSGLCIDLSPDALSIAKKQNKSQNIDIKQADFFKLSQKFDYIFMFEVLEHLKEDQLALKKINSLLNINGLLIFSVPAHQKSFDRDDEWGGHYRRYEKRELFQKLSQANFKLVSYYCYGWPIFSFTRYIYNQITKLSLRKAPSGSKEDKTLNTGVSKENGKLISQLSWLIKNKYVLYVLFLFSNLFIKFDLGPGYLIIAKKC